MPSWTELLAEIQAEAIKGRQAHDRVRRRYLALLHEHTGRNIIVYYSGWLQEGRITGAHFGGFDINDLDKNGFMTAIHKLDRSKGVDLLLHTPGGSMTATESLVDYLRAMFPGNIRAIVPQLAMSGGTMIALAANRVVMGKHSSLGPIDPQINGLPAHGIIEEFENAAKEIQKDPQRIPLWQPIIAKYHPTLIGECYKAAQWSNQMVKQWLVTGMFKDEPDAEERADRAIAELGSHALTLSHARHISLARAAEILGPHVAALEDDQELQDLVLTVHHACIQTLIETTAVKIIENHTGAAFIQSLSLGPQRE